MDGAQDYYAILGLDRDATPDDIRRAYHRKARKLHPDVNQESGATEVFLQIQKAYDVLIEPAARADYDKTLPPKPSTASLVELSTIYSRPSLIHLNEPQLVYALIELAAPANVQTGPSLPLNVCLVIDRSTSMQGERMDMVKSTAIELVRQIRPDDTISIVAFSDRAETLVSAGQRLTRSAIEDQIKHITTGGGTEIYHGLEAGYMEVRSKSSRSSVNHIILITDGRTYGDEDHCLRIADQAAANGIGISGLGIGTEWNDVFLDSLASRTGGNSVYVSRPGELKQFLWQKFSGLGQVYAERVTLDLFFNPGVELTYAFRLSPEVSPLQNYASIPIGNVPLKSNLAILLEIKAPPLFTSVDLLTLAEGKITLDIPGASKSGFKLPIKLSRSVSTAPLIQPPPTRLLQAMSRLKLYRMQERAHQKLAEGQQDSATRHLQHLATHLFAQGKQELARTVLNEIDHIQRDQNISEEGKKIIKYGTRALLLPAGFSDGLAS
jgi:Ca-activated chloride channel family protein